jgi:hypothetical protein
MDARLETSLIQLASMMANANKPWWIIGSTALVLSGVRGLTPDDVDVVADGEMLQRLLGITEPSRKPHEKFQSSPYVRISVAGGMDIEFQGDLALWENNKWTRLLIGSRIEIRFKDIALYVPNLEEQLQIFRRFGRPKDLAKATVLEAFISKSQASELPHHALEP